MEIRPYSLFCPEHHLADGQPDEAEEEVDEEQDEEGQLGDPVRLPLPIGRDLAAGLRQADTEDDQAKEEEYPCDQRVEAAGCGCNQAAADCRSKCKDVRIANGCRNCSPVGLVTVSAIGLQIQVGKPTLEIVLCSDRNSVLIQIVADEVRLLAAFLLYGGVRYLW